ncbi:ATP-binding protein [Spongiactinospora sp. TRM90649]|uniref:ATP-binding protein n=1 Tax=Spongiactinospora sp. TRM90649 TaxID=3031114 RepID=UPI0023F96209|nr:ATP-binding protein [Spongiactinospora sp. TRM90649]MDF5759167.1 ATP-binding protein [Spongiactinospora sp. TRM90649]
MPNPPTPGRPRGPIDVIVQALLAGTAVREARRVVRAALETEGLGEDAIFDAEVAVAELAANAVRHARPPYEVRVFTVAGIPAWCECVDGEPASGRVEAALALAGTGHGRGSLAEHGRGLALVHGLSEGYCRAYTTALSGTGAPGKAVAFALPSRSGARLMFPPTLTIPCISY